jgi:SAM-dependent methyltransferase
MTSWFDRAFGPWYLRLYPHRDLDEARHAVATLSPWLPEGRVLDLGCGHGRYLAALGEAGFAAFGLDRSRHLLGAVTDPLLRRRTVRGDMRRLPFASGSFAAALSMFTSFGYFGSRETHRDVLAEAARVVAPGGRLVLDYLNAPQVRRGLVPESRRVVDGHTVSERRYLEDRPEGEVVVKELAIRDPEGAEVEAYREEVALYDRKQILRLLGEAGWREEHLLGDYDGGAWGPASPRLLVVAARGNA